MSDKDNREPVSIKTESHTGSHWLALNIDPTHPRTYFRYVSEENMDKPDGMVWDTGDEGSCEVTIHDADIVREMGERLLAIADHMEEQND